MNKSTSGQLYNSMPKSSFYQKEKSLKYDLFYLV